MIMDRPKPTPSKRLNLDQLAASPAKRLRLFPDRSINDANAASSSPNSGRRSPDEKCPICISEIKDRAFAGQCLHEFCFLCLFEWCKVKPECPVCRQAFTHIITNVTAIDKYDEVPVPTVPMLMSDSINSTQNPSVFPSRLANWDLNFIRIDLISALNHMRSATHDIPNAAEPTASSSDLASRNLSRDPVNVRFNEIGQFIDNLQSSRTRNWMASEPIVRIEPLPSERDPSFVPPVGTTAFRRHVYENDLYVLPYGNGDSARFRRCSPSLYKANPAWTHRLMHFLKVELMAIVDNLYERQLLTSMIMYSLRKYDILSVQFKIMVEPYIGPRTEHFIHEFYNFARSCYELDNYNRIAVYVPKSEATISKTITSQPVFVVEDSDSEDIPVAIEATPASTMPCDNTQNNSRVSQAIQINPSNNNGQVEMFVNLDFEVPKVPQQESQQTATASAQPEEDDASDNEFTNPKPGPSGLNRFSSNSNLSNIRRNYYDDSDDDSDFEQTMFCPRRCQVYPVKREHFESDDDSIEIIGVVKPIHERTPELIELTDDEDEVEVPATPCEVPLQVQNDFTSSQPDGESLNILDDSKNKEKKRSKKSKKHKKEKKDKHCRKHIKSRRDRHDQAHKSKSKRSRSARAAVDEMMSDDESVDIPLNNGRPKSFVGRVLMPSSQASNLNESRSPSPSIYLNLSSAANVDCPALLSNTTSVVSPLSTLSSISSISSVSSASSLTSSSRSTSAHPSSVSEACLSAKSHKRSRHSSSSSASSSLSAASASSSRSSSSSSSSSPSISSSASSSSSSFTSDRTASQNSNQSLHSLTENNRNTATLISDSLAVINNINRNVNLALNRLPSVIGSVNFNRKPNP